MTDPSLALQKLIFARLVGDAAVTDLVPATSIFDRSGRPERFPCIALGEGYAVPSDRFSTFHEEVFADLHIWTEEPGTTEAKTIAGAVRQALRDGPWIADGHRCHALTLVSTRFMRDPDGLHAHGVATVRAILQELA